MCKKMGLSQQRLADLMETKRGKVAGYFYETQPKRDFHEQLSDYFNLNLGRFLTIEMNEANYESFFLDEERAQTVAEGSGEYQKKSDLIDLLIKAKNAEDQAEVSRLVDEAIKLYGKVLDENSQLREANSLLKDQLLAFKKK